MHRRVFAGALAGLLAGPAAAGPIHDRIYQPPREPLAAPALEGVRLIQVRTADGLTLAGLEKPPQAGRPTLLLLHGNASSAAESMTWFAPLLAQGYGVVAAEYRGYSANPGTPSERGLAADADAFLAQARRTAGGGRLLVVGHSLGAGVGFGLVRRSPADLVTIGAFTRLSALAPALVRPLLTDRYDNLEAVARLERPVFLIHGAADDVVPASALPELHRAGRAAGRHGIAFLIRDADHHPDGALVARLIGLVVDQLDHPERPLEPDLPPGVRAVGMTPPPY